MNMVLINAIRTLGWLDSHGRVQHGNAAVLCYLTYGNNAANLYSKSFLQTKITDIDPRSAISGMNAVKQLLQRTA